MNSIRMLDLSVLATLTAMVFVDALPAMAENTQLCSAEEETCAEGNIITHVHEETLSGAKARILAGATGTVDCDVLFLGDTLGLGNPPVTHGNFTYTNCRLGGTNCTVTEESATSLIEVLRLGHELADVAYEGDIRVRCGIFINCHYDFEGLLATATGPLLSSFANGDVTLTEQTLRVISSICPSTKKLDISMMPLTAVYISR